MATHSSTLAWRTPWTEEPGRLQSIGSLGVGHNWATSLSLFTFMHWRRRWQPLQCSCLENPRDRGAWWAAVYGVAQSWTWLKRLSSSSSSSSSIYCKYFLPAGFLPFYFLDNISWSVKYFIFDDLNVLFQLCFSDLFDCILATI